MTNINDLAGISGAAYIDNSVPIFNGMNDSIYTEIHYVSHDGYWADGGGFKGHAYVSEENKTLVIAFAGTDFGI